MTAVLKHELRLYFRSLTAYVFGAFLLVTVGIGAMLYNLQAAVSSCRSTSLTVRRCWMQRKFRKESSRLQNPKRKG